MEKHEIDIPGPCSVIAGPSRGRSDQTTSLPQVSIRTVVCPGKFFRVRINFTSLTCSGWSQGICSATEMTTPHISNRKLSGSSFSLSSSLGRLSGKSLSISCAAFVGENVRVESVEDSLINDPWLLVIWTLKDEIEGRVRINHDDGSENGNLSTRRSCWACVSQESLGKFQFISSTPRRSHETWQMNLKP